MEAMPITRPAHGNEFREMRIVKCGDCEPYLAKTKVKKRDRVAPAELKHKAGLAPTG